MMFCWILFSFKILSKKKLLKNILLVFYTSNKFVTKIIQHVCKQNTIIL